jgi:hypothetical protein
MLEKSETKGLIKKYVGIGAYFYDNFKGLPHYPHNAGNY